jgi:hypothetical protein
MSLHRTRTSARYGIIAAKIGLLATLWELIHWAVRSHVITFVDEGLGDAIICSVLAPFGLAFVVIFAFPTTKDWLLQEMLVSFLLAVLCLSVSIYLCAILYSGLSPYTFRISLMLGVSLFIASVFLSACRPRECPVCGARRLFVHYPNKVRQAYCVKCEKFYGLCSRLPRQSGQRGRD